MKKRKLCKIAIYGILFVLIFCYYSNADIVHLKNGRQITGTIVEETEDCVVIDIGLGDVTHYKREIKSIEKDTDMQIKDTQIKIKHPKPVKQIAKETVIKLKDGTIKISLSTEWERIVSSKDNQNTLAVSTAWKREDPRAIFDILISDLGYNQFYNTKSYQMKFLGELLTTTKNISKENNEDKWISDEYIKLFGVPALIITFEKKKNIHRGISFVKDCKFYIINFMCEKSKFKNQWANIKQSIKTIEFIR